MILLDIMLKQIKQIEKTLKIGDKFKITYYPQNANVDMEDHQIQPTTRFGIWNKECLFGTHKKYGYGYIKYFDVERNGIRCATTFYKKAIEILLNNKQYEWKEGN